MVRRVLGESFSNWLTYRDFDPHHAPRLNALFDACRHLADSGHEPTWVRARELLND